MIGSSATWMQVALAGLLVVCAAGGRDCRAGGPAQRGAASCTNGAGIGGRCAGVAIPSHGQQRVAVHGGAACGPHGCGPRCHGHHCPRQCCPPGGCHGACCRDLCEQLGHTLHHDVYEKRYFLRSQGKSWHSTWYDPWEGRPIALVVPPTAEFQAQYGWGVPSSRVAPIYHQFRRPYPGPGAVGGAGGGFLPTPNQPSDTVQFGVNAVRGPWGSY